MTESPPWRPALSLVLHDVAPATWQRYRDLVAAVDSLGDIPLTLLVVPDFHRQGRIDRDPAFLAAMARRLARGDELVLHGYYHEDPGPVPWRAKDYFLRRVYTHEGEFYPLDSMRARQRLEMGCQLFERLGWPLRGFVAPAWLPGEATRRILPSLPLRYTSDPGALIRLPQYQRLPAPTLVWSARSAGRRWLSRHWNAYRKLRFRHTALLRLGLHPIDMRYPEVQRYWLDTLSELLRERIPLTKSTWLEQAT